MVFKRKYGIIIGLMVWFSLSNILPYLFIYLNFILLVISIVNILKKFSFIQSLTQGKFKYLLPIYLSFCFMNSITQILPPPQIATTATEINNNKPKEASIAYKMVYGDKNSNKNLSGSKLTEWKAAKTSDKDFTSNIIIEVMSKNGMINKNKMGANPKKELKDCLDSFVKASNNETLKSQDVSSLGMLCAFQMGWK